MKLSRRRRGRGDHSLPPPLTPTTAVGAPDGEPPSLPALVAGIFTRLHVAQRVRVLRRLLRQVGPMALAVVGGGAFAKYALDARWTRMSVSLEDAARVTSAQVFDLVRYVEQANPLVLQQLIAVLARDATTMAALGASVAAIVLQYVARCTPAPASPGKA
jgi:hypothetical protein